MPPFYNLSPQFYNQSPPFYRQSPQFYYQSPQFYHQSPYFYHQPQQSNQFLPRMHWNQNQAYSYDENEAEEFQYTQPDELSQPDELALLTIEQFRAVLKSVFNSKNPKLQIFKKSTYEFQKQHDLPFEAGSVDRGARTFEMLIKNIIRISNVELLEIEENQEIVNPQANSQSHTILELDGCFRSKNNVDINPIIHLPPNLSNCLKFRMDPLKTSLPGIYRLFIEAKSSLLVQKGDQPKIEKFLKEQNIELKNLDYNNYYMNVIKLAMELECFIEKAQSYCELVNQKSNLPTKLIELYFIFNGGLAQKIHTLFGKNDHKTEFRSLLRQRLPEQFGLSIYYYTSEVAVEEQMEVSNILNEKLLEFIKKMAL